MYPSLPFILNFTLVLKNSDMGNVTTYLSPPSCDDLQYTWSWGSWPVPRRWNYRHHSQCNESEYGHFLDYTYDVIQINSKCPTSFAAEVYGGNRCARSDGYDHSHYLKDLGLTTSKPNCPKSRHDFSSRICLKPTLSLCHKFIPAAPNGTYPSFFMFNENTENFTRYLSRYQEQQRLPEEHEKFINRKLIIKCMINTLEIKHVDQIFSLYDYINTTDKIRELNWKSYNDLVLNVCRRVVFFNDTSTHISLRIHCINKMLSNVDKNFKNKVIDIDSIKNTFNDTFTLRSIYTLWSKLKYFNNPKEQKYKKTIQKINQKIDQTIKSLNITVDNDTSVCLYNLINNDDIQIKSYIFKSSPFCWYRPCSESPIFFDLCKNNIDDNTDDNMCDNIRRGIIKYNLKDIDQEIVSNCSIIQSPIAKRSPTDEIQKYTQKYIQQANQKINSTVNITIDNNNDTEICLYNLINNDDIRIKSSIFKLSPYCWYRPCSESPIFFDLCKNNTNICDNIKQGIITYNLKYTDQEIVSYCSIDRLETHWALIYSVSICILIIIAICLMVIVTYFIQYLKIYYCYERA
jgi:hypothetical protein